MVESSAEESLWQSHKVDEAQAYLEYHEISIGMPKGVFFPAVGAALARSTPACIAKVPKSTD
jgi:hypothetical protein